MDVGYKWTSGKYQLIPMKFFWSYEQGTELRDWSLKEVSQYYARLVSWYTGGGFYDEHDKYHESGYYYDIPVWEILNEVEYEHSMTPQYYTQLYDAISAAIHEVNPDIKFVGMALAGRELNWVQYFLNSSNHAPDVTLDYISFHFYASCNNRTSVEEYNTFFSSG